MEKNLKKNTCICITESLYWIPETNITWWINYSSIIKKKIMDSWHPQCHDLIQSSIWPPAISTSSEDCGAWAPHPKIWLTPPREHHCQKEPCLQSAYRRTCRWAGRYQACRNRSQCCPYTCFLTLIHPPGQIPPEVCFYSLMPPGSGWWGRTGRASTDFPGTFPGQQDQPGDTHQQSKSDETLLYSGIRQCHWDSASPSLSPWLHS